MRTSLLLLAFLFLTLISCKEENKKTPLDLEHVWYSGKMLDKEPQIVKGNSDSVLYRISNFMGKEKINQLNIKYNLLIDKQGNLKQLTILESNNPKVDSIVISTVKDWKFSAGVKSGKNVNSIYSINLDLRVTGSLKPISEKEYATSVEEMPMPVGGLYSIQSKIKYPEIAKRAGIEGKVFIQVFIDEDGNVVEAKVIKGIGAGCDAAALDAVKQTKFTPGKQNGKPVKVQVSIPIVFKLQ
jgi:TonB family protein